MSDVIEVIYRFRDMAGKAADELREEIAAAQVVLDRLDRFANDAQNVAELSAASDLFPTYHAMIPPEAGLVSKQESPRD